MTKTPPYVSSQGNLRKVLQKILEAATPERFTQDFLETKLGLSGGSARPLIPFLKRIGFLGSDGTPTNLYKLFRNSTESGAAAAQALKLGYSEIFKVNEYAHDLTDGKLKGVLVQITGQEEGSAVIRFIIASFKTLKEFCTFDKELESGLDLIQEQNIESAMQNISIPPQSMSNNGVGLNLSYTINLNLPATSDISVFNAIFKSLKENLLSDK